MKFRGLVENLRAILWERIQSGELTGLDLARRAGFRQAHISNFLNQKRGLSIEGLDQVLAVQRLSVLDLLDPQELSRRARVLPPSDGDFENVMVVDPGIAATQPVMISHHVRDTIKVRGSSLKRLRAEVQGDRRSWQRFVAIKVEAREGMSMYPRLLPGALVVIDRHYNSLKPYRKQERNLYAVRNKDQCVLKYLEHAGKQFLLRPENPAYPVELLALEPGESVASRIVGRVVKILMNA